MIDGSQLLLLLPEPALLVTPAGRILVANGAAARLVGASVEGLDETSLERFVDGPADALADYLRLCARSRQLVPGALRWRTVDGSVVPMRCDGAVIVPRSAESPAVIFLRGRPKDEATDRFALLNRKIDELTQEILARRKAQHERDELLERERAARVQAENMGRLKDEFLATLSHELRTPLNAILGWSRVLASRAAEADRERGLETIARNARSQAKIIDDLLDVSRIVSGKIRLDVQSVALAPLIDSVVESLRPAAEAKSLRVQATLDPLAGPVKGDPNRLQQVVWNLLSNAIKFTPKGGRIQVFLERVNSHVEITVSDDGEGIAPDFLPYVFDRFQQADGSTTRRYGGLGLGLSIVKQLVELHGGSARAKSPGLGKGATFMVLLPVALSMDPASDSGRYRRHPAVSDERSSRPSLPPALLAGIRALVVDDEADARDLLTTLLVADGATVVAVDSVAAALRRLETETFDVVLSDVGMPDEDGYQLARRVRSASAPWCRTPMLAVTAFARTDDRTRALVAGFNAHMSKPLEPSELVAAVASLIGRFAVHA